MSFCTSLRRRSSFASALPLLTSRDTLALRENQLNTHDIELPLPSPACQADHKENARRYLRILLLSPISVSEEKTAATLSRVHHFASLTGGMDVAIVMLLHSSPAITSARAVLEPSTDNTRGVHAYTKLQAEVFALTDLPYIPILPLRSIAGLVHLLKSYSQSETPLQRMKVEPLITASDLVGECTVCPPLSRFAVHLTTDVFESIRHLAAEATALTAATAECEGRELTSSSDMGCLQDESQPGFSMLRSQMDVDVVEGMIKYWEEEYAVD